MPTPIKKKFTTNSRVISELLTKYKNTFYALCELINNSIQAKATEIHIDVKYTNNQLSKAPIEAIHIKDNGFGVPISEFEDRIMDVGTNYKKGGQGIGRFSALQIGNEIEIETVGWDDSIKKFTKSRIAVDADKFEDKKLRDIDFSVYEEVLEKSCNSYYSVLIKNLHHGKHDKTPKKNLIVKELLEENIRLSIFEKYPYEVFNNKVSFFVNGSKLNRDEFITELPTIKEESYTNILGKEYTASFYFYNIKLPSNKVKVFLQVDNSGIKTVAHEFSYSSDWYTPELGPWFIYIESSMFNSDLFRNLDLEELGDEEQIRLKNFIKEVVSSFFISRNKKFDEFTNKLITDKFYPYKEDVPASSAQEALFKKVAFLIEGEYKLITRDSKIRDLIYPLIDRAIRDGNIHSIFEKILKLDEKGSERFNDLLNKTDLESVIHFTNQVADKIEFLDFLHELVYGDLSKVLKERSQLHKIVENELWLFGEAYNSTPQLWSDQKIGKILGQIRSDHISYEPSESDENLISLQGEGVNDITDLFFTNEKVLDDGTKEYMIVELKAPKCAISQKEINQIDRYAFTIEKHDGLPANNVKYKLILISSKLTSYAKSKMDSQFEVHRKPFLFDKKVNKNIEVYLMSWSELIELNRRKLGYLSEQLKIKDKSVKQKFEEEYPTLINNKVRTVLTKIA